jgi:hypothetical protein
LFNLYFCSSAKRLKVNLDFFSPGGRKKGHSDISLPLDMEPAKKEPFSFTHAEA